MVLKLDGDHSNSQISSTLKQAVVMKLKKRVLHRIIFSDSVY